MIHGQIEPAGLHAAPRVRSMRGVWGSGVPDLPALSVLHTAGNLSSSHNPVLSSYTL